MHFGSTTSHTRYFGLIQVLEKSFHLFFNLKTDPERGGRELSIAHKIRVETCWEGSHTPLKVSGKGVKVVDHMGRPLSIPGISFDASLNKKVSFVFQSETRS